MGFGLLFIGYLMTMLNVPMLGAIGTLIRIGGCAIMLCAVVRLRRYCGAFSLSLIGVALMSVMSVLLLLVNADSLLYKNLLTSTRLFTDFGKTVVGYAEQGVSFVFNSLLLWGIYSIAREMGVKSIWIGAVRNYIFVCAYYVVYIVSFLPFSFICSAGGELAIIAWVLFLAWIALNLYLIFSCYAKICDEEDEDMDKCSIKNETLNGFLDAFNVKAQNARSADALYRQRMRERRKEKKRKRK